MKIKSFKIFNEGVKEVVIGLTTFLSLGLSKMDAQCLKSHQDKLAVIDAIDTANKHHTKTIEELKKRNINYNAVKPYIVSTKSGVLLDKNFVSAPINGLIRYDVPLIKRWRMQGTFYNGGVPTFNITYRIQF